MRMLRIVASIVVITASAGIANAGGSTAFTYQGRLLDAGEPANGLFDFEFSLWDADVGGNQIGSTQIHNAAPVTDGLFTITIDLGDGAFNGNARWLAITVNGTPLSPRQPLTPAPYALRALRPWAISPINKSDIFYNAGNVGIGTTSPTSPLHISRFLNGAHLIATVENTGPFSAAAVQVKTAAPGNDWLLVAQDTGGGAAEGFRIDQSGIGTRIAISVNGNVGIGIVNAIHPLEMASGAHVTFGGVWTDVSDANRKENINPVDAREILDRVRDLPISTWNFKDENKSIRHLGPTAQDFHAAFALGPDDKHLASLDSGGVALAAVQGLDELVREKEKEITDLKARLAALEALVDRLVLDRSGGAP